MTYEGPLEIVPDSGFWYFKRIIDEVQNPQLLGPYPSRENAQENLERVRKYDNLAQPGGLNQFINAPSSWREICRDVFGPTSIEAFPPRGSRG